MVLDSHLGSNTLNGLMSARLSTALISAMCGMFQPHEKNATMAMISNKVLNTFIV